MTAEPLDGFPPGVVTSLLEGDGPSDARDIDVSVAALLALAAAYQLAEFRLTSATQRAARTLWLQLRPITDADLGEWMAAWNSMLAGAARQQALLTQAYVTNSLRQFGVTFAPTISVDVSRDTTDIDGWLDGPYGRSAPQSLRQEVVNLKAAVAERRVGIQEAALRDRLAYLHSPVIKQRWRVSEGRSFDEALDDVLPSVDDTTYAAQRAVEEIVQGAQRWPTFQNGLAMMYRRVPQAGACGWCKIVATRLYSVESFKAGAQWHNFCHCTWQAVTFDQANAYVQGLRDSRGNYYEAARRIGLWEGDDPDYDAVVRERATGEGAAAPGAPRTRRNTPTAAVSAAEQRARDLQARANGLAAEAREAVAAGNIELARALYDQARELSGEAYRLRTSGA